MNSKTKIKIEFSQVETDFHGHLINPQNSRILFTAPFGAGKSTFLRDFFLKYQTHFVSINLYPVNYAVAGNEDIFELIKYDILSELLGRYSESLHSLKKEEFGFALQAQVFALHSNESVSFIKSVISASSKIGKSAIEILNAFEKLSHDFKKFREGSTIDNKITIEDYLEALNSRKGSIYEADDISYIISRCLQDLKIGGNGEKDVILIIDDLDRLDPDHIFRLFNVFSAHYDSVTEQNKFGFDKVVFVCDIANIQKMYSHRYGREVDFNGYMDKYYSSAPFSFDSRMYLVEKLDEFLLAKRWKMDEGIEEFLGGSFKSALRFVLLSLISANKLTLRMLDHSPVYTVWSNTVINPSNHPYKKTPAYMFPFYLLINYLNSLYPNANQLEVAIDTMAQKYGADFIPGGMDLYSMPNIRKYIIQICLPFIIPAKDIFDDESTDNKEASIACPGQDGCFVRYTLSSTSFRSPHKDVFFHGSTISADKNSASVNINIYTLLNTTLKLCKERGIFEQQ